MDGRAWRYTIASALVACGGGGGTGAVDAPPAGSFGDAPSPQPQIGTVVDETAAPVAGATVCVVDHPELACATTDASGSYTIQVPPIPGAQLGIEATGSGHFGGVALAEQPFPATGAIVWPEAIVMRTSASASAFFGGGNFVFPEPDTGFVELRVVGANGSGLAGVTATLHLAASIQVPELAYFDGSGVPDFHLTATTSSGGVVFGGIPVGRTLSDGTHEPSEVRADFAFAAPSGTCTASPGGALASGDLAPGGSNTVATIVATDALTAGVTVTCE